MDWIDGKTWTEFRATAGPNARSAAAQTITRFIAECGFKLGMNYADPHPGNFLFLKDRVAFLDFGRIQRFAPKFQAEFKRLHELLIKNDKEQAREFLNSNSLFKLLDPGEFETVWSIALALTGHLRGEKKTVFSLDDLVRHRRLIAEAAQMGAVQITPEFFWTMLFTHTMVIAGRSDLEASGDWRGLIRDGLNVRE